MMGKKPQPETLEVIVNDAEEHENYDGSVGCEGGARSSARESKIFSDKRSKPFDTAVKELVSKVTGH